MVDSKPYPSSNEKFVSQAGIKVPKEHRHTPLFVTTYVRSYVHVNASTSSEKAISEQFFSLKLVRFLKIETREDEGPSSRLSHSRYFKIDPCFKSLKRVTEYPIPWRRFFSRGQPKQPSYIFLLLN